MQNKPRARYVLDWKNKGQLEWYAGIVPYTKGKARKLLQHRQGLLGKYIRYRIRPVE